MVYTSILINFYLIPTKSVLVYTLLNRCFRICSNWSMFHSQLTRLKEMKNGCQENFIDICFKFFFNRIRILKKILQLKKKPLRLVLPYLGTISLQTRTNLQKSIKRVLNCCKLTIFTSKTLFPNSFISCGLQVSMWIM